MQEINIKVWRNDSGEAWSIEINGFLHEGVSTDVLEGLVEVAIILAEKALTDAATQLRLISHRSAQGTGKE